MYREGRGRLLLCAGNVDCREQSLSFRFRVRKSILFIVVFFKGWSG